MLGRISIDSYFVIDSLPKEINRFATYSETSAATELLLKRGAIA
jgi:hypothetical protein